MSAGPAWYRNRAVLRFFVFHYLPWFAALSLVWEAVHVRLYTLWSAAAPAYVAFAVFHCTLGDVLIGASALLLALILSGAAGFAEWRSTRIALLTTVFGTTYTVWSEWMNVTLLRSWTYADSMPRLPIGDFELGLTPLLQWLIIPSLALQASRRTSRQQ